MASWRKIGMKTNPVAWFEIPVKDLTRAKKFYETVFDFELTTLEMGPRKMLFFPMTNDTYGSSGALVKEESFIPSYEGTVVYFSVSDIDVILGKITVSGGKTILPKMPIGEYGFVAYFEDSEGNRVALHTMK
jgi:uncharacterized protein